MSLKKITLAIAISFASCQGGISAEPPKTETGSQLSTKGFQFKLPGGYGPEDVINKGAPVVGIVALSGFIGKYRHQLSAPLFPMLQNSRICPNSGSILSLGLMATGISLFYPDALNQKFPRLESIGFYTLYDRSHSPLSHSKDTLTSEIRSDPYNANCYVVDAYNNSR